MFHQYLVIQPLRKSKSNNARLRKFAFSKKTKKLLEKNLRKRERDVDVLLKNSIKIDLLLFILVAQYSQTY